MAGEIMLHTGKQYACNLAPDCSMLTRNFRFSGQARLQGNIEVTFAHDIFRDTIENVRLAWFVNDKQIFVSMHKLEKSGNSYVINDAARPVFSKWQQIILENGKELKARVEIEGAAPFTLGTGYFYDTAAGLAKVHNNRIGIGENTGIFLSEPSEAKDFETDGINIYAIIFADNVINESNYLSKNLSIKILSDKLAQIKYNIGAGQGDKTREAGIFPVINRRTDWTAGLAGGSGNVVIVGEGDNSDIIKWNVLLYITKGRLTASDDFTELSKLEGDNSKIIRNWHYFESSKVKITVGLFTKEEKVFIFPIAKRLYAHLKFENMNIANWISKRGLPEAKILAAVPAGSANSVYYRESNDLTLLPSSNTDNILEFEIKNGAADYARNQYYVFISIERLIGARHIDGLLPSYSIDQIDQINLSNIFNRILPVKKHESGNQYQPCYSSEEAAGFIFSINPNESMIHQISISGGAAW
jgi:hypothetical protein